MKDLGKTPRDNTEPKGLEGEHGTDALPIESIEEILDDLYVSTHNGKTPEGVQDGDIDRKDIQQAAATISKVVREAEARAYDDIASKYIPKFTEESLNGFSKDFHIGRNTLASYARNKSKQLKEGK